MYGELLARPGEPLLEHLLAVGELARAYAPDGLKQEALLAGRVHDIAKATSFFQRRLRGEYPPTPQTYHAYPSALLGAWAAKRLGFRGLPVFLAVARHHGHLRAPVRLLVPEQHLKDPDHVRDLGLRRTLAALQEQLRDLDRPDFYDLARALELPDPTPFLRGEAWEVLAQLYREAEDIELLGEDRALYWEVGQLFSALIDADKKLAAQVQLPERKAFLPDLVDRYLAHLKETHASTPLDNLRDRLYQGVDARIREESLDRLFPAVLTLTAPTGSGKTLTALNAALKLRDRVRREQGQHPRIVYALPFINLIEQNYGVIRSVLEHAGLKPEDYLIQHHHLAALLEETQNEEELEELLLLAEAWDKEIIITTFVQVFHTLVGHRNRFLKKLHNFLGGSILILDEVQSLPAEHWPLVREVLRDFVRMGNTVILMTATQPRLLEEGVELAPRIPEWPIRILVRRTEALPAEPSGRSRIIVVNTVRRSLEVYEALKAAGAAPLYYLSTNVTPFERRDRITAIGERLRNKEPVTLVATQVVEAGVNLDFAEGWREIGPLDAVIQVAGRVNRNGEEEGVLWLVEGNLESAHRIYGRILPDLTHQLLPRETTDRDLEGLLPRYFAEVERRISQQKAHEVLEALERLDYDAVGGFSLIEALPSVPIFVELNDEASGLLGRLQEALTTEDPRKRRLKLRALWPQLEAFLINPIAQRALKNLPPPLFAGTPYEREDFRYIPRDGLEYFYDRETGFRWKDGSIALIL